MTVQVQNKVTKRIVTIEVAGAKIKDAATAAAHVAKVMPGWSVVDQSAATSATSQPAKKE